jgi:alpha,alpha-trehalose phosphorylase
MQNKNYEIKNFKLDTESLLLGETLFHNANGYIGVRANFEEGYQDEIQTIRGMYINGFYDFSEMKQAEKLFGLVEEKQTMLNVVDTQGIKLYIDDEEFTMFEGTVLESARWLDMSQGVTGRKVLWRSPQGKEVEIVIKRMASFTRLSLFTIDYQVTLKNCSGRISFVSRHKGDVMNYFDPDDPRVAAERFQHIHVKKVEVKEDCSFIISETALSHLSVCSGVKNLINKKNSITTIKKSRTGVDTTITNDVVNGESVRLIKYTSITDSIRYSEFKKICSDQLTSAFSIPIEEFYNEQESYLAKCWKMCDLNIYGDDDLNLALKYNMYQLIQSVTKDEFGNIAAKGLSGEGYEGHYFWDTEMFIQPFFVLTMPDFCKNLISMRYKILDYARENSKLMGYDKGALFPWRTIMGKECSGHYPSGTAQVHINGDIAYSIIAYYLVTGDFDFIVQIGAEILFEISRHWMESGNFHKGKFQINSVTGPDEYTCIVNNNYYTNALAKYCLYWAAKVYDLLEKSDGLSALEQKIGISKNEAEDFIKASECMSLPYDEELDINPQDDAFLQKKMWDFASTPKKNYPLLLHYHPLHLYRYQVCKQADTVMSYFVLEDYQGEQTMRNSFDYYEKITTHDSSLSSCIFSIVASRLGYMEKAYAYYGDSAKLDLFNTHNNTKDGIHTANMGGNYMAIVYGFAGLRIKEDGLYFSPLLPEQWEGYDFSIRYRGSVITIRICRGKCSFILSSGSPQRIMVYGKEYILTEKINVDLGIPARQPAAVVSAPS